MFDFQLKISRYLDGELDDNEVAELAAVLASDVASIDALVFSSLIHTQLLSWLNQEEEQHDALAEDSDRRNAAVDNNRWHAGTLSTNRVRSAGSNWEVPRPLPPRERWRSHGAIAASLLVAASISAFAYWFASRPGIVGQLTETNRCRWSASTTGIAVGSLLQNGQDLELLEGTAIITFSSGAKVYLEGPVSLHLESPMKVRLDNGKIAAKVPRQAIGFTVTSNLGRFIDLGTAFTLSLAKDKSFQLHVFEGLVELQLDERFGEAARNPARVAQIHAIGFDIDSGDLSQLHFEEGKTMPF